MKVVLAGLGLANLACIIFLKEKTIINLLSKYKKERIVRLHN